MKYIELHFGKKYYSQTSKLTEKADGVHRVLYRVPIVIILSYKCLNGFTFLVACLHRKKSPSSVSNSSLPRLAWLLDDAKITQKHASHYS